jgi:glycosyltransferase involved in cell wall biosynthesis
LPGTIEPRKQQLLVMELFNKFIQNHPEVNVELITFGHSNYPHYIINEQIQKSKNKIKYLGIISNTDMMELYKTATFSCFLSKYEGYGLPVAESLWHGVPVLTSCLGSMAEIASCGGCYCINAYNPTDIYDALCILIKNPKIVLKLKEDLLKTKLISWDDYAENIYKEISIFI